MEDNKLNRFLGGSPGAVAIRLVFLSFIVGIILSAINLNPLDIFLYLQNFVLRLWDLGFEAIARLGGYFVLGAIVVLPIWLISRLFKSG
ncbi:DUF6460 domain-containing protein [Flexibacterium corallicola]|uniref:DUF6460 domain-containing protein n=1 Tax=Flexibacterium corallicola TaxID=3037259 RepID=UPI00286F2E40|nr:DUF6460 domain-containing protein [Pseudovibrio sp. M1P-2-3]